MFHHLFTITPHTHIITKFKIWNGCNLETIDLRKWFIVYKLKEFYFKKTIYSNLILFKTCVTKVSKLKMLKLWKLH